MLEYGSTYGFGRWVGLEVCVCISVCVCVYHEVSVERGQRVAGPAVQQCSRPRLFCSVFSFLFLSFCFQISVFGFPCMLCAWHGGWWHGGMVACGMSAA